MKLIQIFIYTFEHLIRAKMCHSQTKLAKHLNECQSIIDNVDKENSEKK